MTQRLQLSELAAMVQDTIEQQFYYDSFWITAEICDVKRYDSKRWCFLKFIEKQGRQIATEMQAVFWSAGYQHIIAFERLTRQPFKDGIEISCKVQVKFHPRFGLKLEVQEIDTSFAVGKIELERQQTLDRLLKENPATIRLVDEEYITFNKQLKLPKVIQRIALITAPNSDGQRDFQQELLNNRYGYRFHVTEFLTQLQGDAAAGMICNVLKDIYYRAPDFDAVAIVRGGGSQTDFKTFDNYELAKQVALFSIPVFTGIGHDRNTSITDLMARQEKTPTKVAAAIADINFRFEHEVQFLGERLQDAIYTILESKQRQLDRWAEKMKMIVPQRVNLYKTSVADCKYKLAVDVQRTINRKNEMLIALNTQLGRVSKSCLTKKQAQLESAARLVHQLSPQTILNRGFAMVLHNNAIITDATTLSEGQTTKTILKKGAIDSTVTKIITRDENEF